MRGVRLCGRAAGRRGWGVRMGSDERAENIIFERREERIAANTLRIFAGHGANVINHYLFGLACRFHIGCHFSSLTPASRFASLPQRQEEAGETESDGHRFGLWGGHWAEEG